MAKPLPIEREQVHDDHREAQIGEVDEREQADVHEEHERPDRGAGAAGEGERRVEELECEGAPSHQVQRGRRQAEDRGAKERRPRERIHEHVRDRGAVDPGRAGELRPAAVAVRDGGDDPGDFEPAGRIGGVDEQHPADERERRIADQRIAAEEAREDVPDDHRRGAIVKPDRQRDRGDGGDCEQRDHECRSVRDREHVRKKAHQRTTGQHAAE